MMGKKAREIPKAGSTCEAKKQGCVLGARRERAMNGQMMGETKRIQDYWKEGEGELKTGKGYFH
jgi:hypothetical protein